MCDNCIVCGVKFDESSFENKRCTSSGYDWNNEICHWCFSYAPIEFIRVVKHGGSAIIDIYDNGVHKKELYTQLNYKEYPVLKERIKDLGLSSSVPSPISTNSCPRCNGKLIKKIAQEPFTGKDYTIDKCQNCGWC